MSEPCELSAVDARALIGARKLSPVELLESCIAQIERLDATLNAFPIRCFDRARSEAAEAENAVVKGDPLGVLHGLPLGVKDLNDLAGVRTTQGSPLFETFVAQEDDNIVAAMRAAGAVAVGKTNAEGTGVETEPYTSQDVMASVCKALGISLETTFTSNNGRPMKIANSGKVIKELFS